MVVVVMVVVVMVVVMMVVVAFGSFVDENWVDCNVSDFYIFYSPSRIMMLIVTSISKWTLTLLYIVFAWNLCKLL